MRTRRAPTMAFEGRLTQWDDARGSGFIEVEATRERLFVHASALPGNGWRPALGARLLFDVGRDGQGRKRAVDVRLVDARHAVARGERPEREFERMPRPRLRRGGRWPVVAAALAILGVVAATAWRALPHRTPAPAAVPRALQAAPARPAIDADASRTCDGRTTCPQMTSCAQATWFLQHCPGVKMDGNHDGVPCEQQWCTAR